MAKKATAVNKFREGADARYTGKSLTACPYSFNSPEAKEWRDGWKTVGVSMSKVESEGGEAD